MKPILCGALWAAFVSLDVTAWGPWMMTQPVVCGPLMGWAMGNVFSGIVIGGILQLLCIDVVPVGVGIPYDAAASTMLAVYWSATLRNASWEQYVLALAVAIPCGFLFRMIDIWARRLNAFFSKKLDDVSNARLEWALVVFILTALLWSYARYFVLYLLLLWSGEWAWFRLMAWTGHLAPWIHNGLSMAAFLLPVAGMGVVLELFLSEEPERRLALLRRAWRGMSK